MSVQVVLELLALFFGGILGGLEICAHFGFQAPIVELEQEAQIRFRQGAVHKLRWLVPAFFLPAAFSGISLTLVQGVGPGVLFRCAAAASLLVWIAVRTFGTVPINAASVEWSAHNPPADWRAQIQRAERFHVVGTWAALAAFAFFLLSVGTRLSS